MTEESRGRSGDVGNRRPDEALDRWYKRYNGRSDNPGVRVWMPTSLPTAYLLTTSHGCQQPDTLNPGPPMIHVRVGGVEFGGYLDDIEVMFAAALEAIGYTRRQYLEMCQAEGREPEVPFHVKDEALTGGSGGGSNVPTTR